MRRNIQNWPILLLHVGSHSFHTLRERVWAYLKQRKLTIIIMRKWEGSRLLKPRRGGWDNNLEEMVKEIEAKESGKLARKTVGIKAAAKSHYCLLFVLSIFVCSLILCENRQIWQTKRRSKYHIKMTIKLIKFAKLSV